MFDSLIKTLTSSKTDWWVVLACSAFFIAIFTTIIKIRHNWWKKRLMDEKRKCDETVKQVQKTSEAEIKSVREQAYAELISVQEQAYVKMNEFRAQNANSIKQMHEQAENEINVMKSCSTID